MPEKRFFKTRDDVEVTFTYDRPEAGSVALVCEEQGWDALAMKRSARGKGPWALKVRLPRSRRIQYRYLVDGESWENDPFADAWEPNHIDGDNSVVSTDPS